MRRHHESRLLPYTCEQLFDLALDIERYPEFVPGYVRAGVTAGAADTMDVDQSIGLGPACVRFRSRAEFSRPDRIAIRAVDGPFKRLEVEWCFAAEQGRCRVTFAVRYQLAGVFAAPLAAWLDLIAPRLLEAFARRAAQIYGTGA